jgi:DNA polymerase-3 subunit epsilon
VWAKTQAAELQEHFRKSDPNAVVDGAWPVAAVSS